MIFVIVISKIEFVACHTLKNKDSDIKIMDLWEIWNIYTSLSVFYMSSLCVTCAHFGVIYLISITLWIFVTFRWKSRLYFVLLWFRIRISDTYQKVDTSRLRQLCFPLFCNFKAILPSNQAGLKTASIYMTFSWIHIYLRIDIKAASYNSC